MHKIVLFIAGCVMLLCSSAQALTNPPQHLITLNFQQMPIRGVLQQLAQFAHINCVISPKVSGNISLYLDEVTWQQALATILQSQGLAKRFVDGVWYIAPASAIANQEKALLDVATQSQELAPLQVEFFKLRYAKASDIAKILNDSNGSFVGKRGQVLVDKRTNSLIVRDTEPNIEEISNLINKLDQPLEQVHITAKIMVVDQTALQELGVMINGHGGGSAPGDVTNALVNLPVTNPAGVIGAALGVLPGGLKLNVEIQALESEGDGQVISEPELTVSNNQQASIEQGSEIPFQTSTPSGATQVEFKKAVLGLEVTPQITPDHHLVLNLTVTNDAVTKNKGTAQNIPIIAASSIHTRVLVNNGQTVVLGGIHLQEEREDERRVPWLGKLPVLGWLFRNKSKTFKDSELVVFVTPTIQPS